MSNSFQSFVGASAKKGIIPIAIKNYPITGIQFSHVFTIGNSDINRPLFYGPNTVITEEILTVMKKEIIDKFAFGPGGLLDPETVRKMIIIALYETDISQPIHIIFQAKNPNVHSEPYWMMNFHSQQLGGEMAHINHMMLILAKYITQTKDWVSYQYSSPFPHLHVVRWYDGTCRVLGGSTEEFACTSAYYLHQCPTGNGTFGDYTYNEKGASGAACVTVFNEITSPIY